MRNNSLTSSNPVKFCYPYPRAAIGVDILVLAQGNPNQILLIERAADPYQGYKALPGGFFQPEETEFEACDESIEQTALRELKEETGLELQEMDLRLVGCFSRRDRDPRGRVVSLAYLSILPEAIGLNAGSDASQAEWYPLKAALVEELAFDHSEILHRAVSGVLSEFLEQKAVCRLPDNIFF